MIRAAAVVFLLGLGLFIAALLIAPAKETRTVSVTGPGATQTVVEEFPVTQTVVEEYPVTQTVTDTIVVTGELPKTR